MLKKVIKQGGISKGVETIFMELVKASNSILVNQVQQFDKVLCEDHIMQKVSPSVKQAMKSGQEGLKHFQTVLESLTTTFNCIYAQHSLATQT